MKLFRVLGTALLSAALTTSVQAQSVSLDFNDPATWGSPADGLVLGGITFANPNLDAAVVPTSFDCSTLLLCEGVLQGAVGGTLGFSFGGPLASLQFNLGRVNNLASFLTLYDSNGAAFLTRTLTPTLQSDPVFGEFFGDTFSWTAIGTFAYSAVLSHDYDESNPDNAFEAYELDNLTGTMATTVPEPATVGLLAFGLVGIAVARRRRV